MGQLKGSEQTNIPLQSVESHWQRIFEKYDRDHDGRIALRELSATVKSSNFVHDIPAHVSRKLIDKFDHNQDGYLTFPEFLSMVDSQEGREVFKRWWQSYIHYAIPPRNKKRSQTVTDGEYEEEYSCNPPAIGMLLISVIEISIFLYDIFSVHNNYIDGPAATLFIYNPHKRIEVWRFITYMFVHVGTFHLIVNLLVQILLGIPLEMVHGWWRVLIVYICGVLAGSLGTSVSDPRVYLAGASGGVYAIIAAHLATIILNWSEMQFAGFQLVVFLIIATVDIGTAVYQRYVLNLNVQIGYVAHFTGALAGLLVGIYVLRNLQVHSWEKKLCWAALFFFIFLMAFAIVWNILYPSYFPPQAM